MNLICEMLPGMDTRGGTQSILKNISESGKNNRFDELLKEQAERGETEETKEKKLLEQILAGQGGTVICPQVFWGMKENLPVSLQVIDTGALSENFANEGIQPLGKGVETEGTSQKETPVGLPRMPGKEAEGTVGKGEESIFFDSKPAAGIKLQDGELTGNKNMGEESFTERDPSQVLHLEGFPMKDVEYFHQTGVKDVTEDLILEAKPDMQKLSDSILKHITNEAREFEVWLHPRNLGSLMVKASYEEGRTTISLVSGEAKVIQSMLQNAGELADMLKIRLGGPMEVIIDVPNSDYLEHQRDDQKSREHDQQRSQKEAVKEIGEENGENFLHQLRLGLM